MSTATILSLNSRVSELTRQCDLLFAQRNKLRASLEECRSILLGIRKAHASDWPMITVQRMDDATSRALIALKVQPPLPS